MTELFKIGVTPAIRALVLVFGGWMVSHGIWSESVAGKIVESLTVAGVAWAWAMWEKYKDRILLNTAAAMPQPTSVQEIKQAVKDGKAPPASVPQDRVPYLAGQKPDNYSTDAPA